MREWGTKWGKVRHKVRQSYNCFWALLLEVAYVLPFPLPRPKKENWVYVIKLCLLHMSPGPVEAAGPGSPLQVGGRPCIQWRLHCTALNCTTLHCTALHCTALHLTALHCTALHCTALHCTELHCTALHYTALHCTALYLAHCVHSWQYSAVSNLV